MQELLSSSLLYKNINIKIHRNLIFPVVLYGYETWSLALTSERRLKMFENRVLRRIMGCERDEVTGEWRNLYNDVVKYQYSSPYIIWMIISRKMRRAGYVECMGAGEPYTGY